MLLWTVLLFIVDKSGWCYYGLCCCLYWLSQVGVIMDCVAIHWGDKSGQCYYGLCCCLLWISQAGVILGCVVVYSG